MKRRQTSHVEYSESEDSDGYADEDVDINDDDVQKILHSFEDSRQMSPLDRPNVSLGIEDVGRLLKRVPGLEPIINGIIASIQRNPQVFLFITANVALLVYIFSHSWQ